MAKQVIEKSKKIVFFDFPGHSFVHDLSKSLSKKKKYNVYHLYNPKQLGPKSNFKDRISEKIIPIKKNFSRNFYIRFFDESIYSFQCIYKIIKINPDILIASSMPLIPLYFLSLLKKFMRYKIIFWMQDIQSVAIDKILTRKKNRHVQLVSRLFYFLENSIIQLSDSVIFITEDFKKYFNSKILEKNIYIINNWGSLENIKPQEKLNSFSKENKIAESFNVLYSGTLGYKHNPDVLINLSIFLQEKGLKAKILIVSEGPVVEYLKSEAKKLNIKNILFFPFQKFDDFSKVLASAEVSLVLLEKDSSDFCVPSKFLSILCAKRIPVVNTNRTNLVSKIIIENKCGLIADNQSDLNNQLEELIKNYENFNHFAENGYNYACKNFNINDITDKFEKIIQKNL